MATVTSELTPISTADATTGFSGTSGQLDTEVFKQGTGAYTYQTGKNGIEPCTFTPSTALDFTSTENRQAHLYWTMRCDVFPFCELLNTGATNSGLMVRLTDGTGNFIQWHIAGKDTWDGSWRNWVLNVANTANVHSSSGTLVYTDITLITWYTDNSNSGQIRIIDNTWLDAIRIGYGLISNTTVAETYDIEDVAIIDEATTNYYAVTQEFDGVLFTKGGLQLGNDPNTITGVDNKFSSVNEVVMFGPGLIGYDHYKIKGESEALPIKRGSTLYASDATAFDIFGSAVSVSNDGLVLIVGAYGWNTSASGEGGVYTYDKNGTSWTQRGSVLESDTPADLLEFGRAVTLSGDGLVLVVSASLGTGKIYTYDKNGTSWDLRSKYVSPDAIASSEFGSGVSLSDNGTVLIVGAANHSSGAFSNNGIMFTLDKFGDTWSQRGDFLVAPDATNSYRFGSSCALSNDGNVMAVGSENHGSVAATAGALYIFDRTGSTWTQRGSILTASDAASSDNFGGACALSGDANTLTVGAPFHETAGTDTGAIYIYKRSGDVWVQRGAVFQSNPTINSVKFGSSCAITSDSSILSVGLPVESSSFSNQGAVIVYDISSLDSDIKFNGFVCKCIAVADGSITNGPPPAYFDMSAPTLTFLMENSSLVNIGYIDIAQGNLNSSSFINCGYTNLLYGLSSNNCSWDGSRHINSLYGSTIANATFDNLDTIDSSEYIITSDLENLTDCTLVQSGTHHAIELDALPSHAIAYNQRGSILVSGDIIADDQFGSSVSITGDGLILAVGAPYSETTGNGTGGVYIYDKSGSSWVQRGAILEASDATNLDYFGSSVALSNDGDILSVGSSDRASGGSTRGGIYIYDRNGTSWTQRGSVLVAADAADGDNFGVSCDLSDNGDVLAVGAENWVGAAGLFRGGVYIYDRNVNTWTQRGVVLEPADAADVDRFGSDVALSGDGEDLAVGARTWEGGVGNGVGGVYIFDRNVNTWTQRGSVLEAANAIDNDEFGGSVALSNDGKILLVGAENPDTTDYGYVYTFDINGTGWNQRGSVLTASDKATSDYFSSGISISDNGNELVVGARGWEDVVSNTGGVYIFDRDSDAVAWNNYLTGFTATDGLTSSAIHVTDKVGNLIINVGAGYTIPSILTDGATVTVISGQVTVNITVQDAISKAAIEGARVYITAAETTADYTLGDELFNGLTNASGAITFNLSLTEPLNIGKRARRSTTTPLYKTAPISATINNISGLDLTVQMIPDE